jgi:hypothetical protein
MFEAFVVSVEHDAAAFERSPQAGWDWWGTPVVAMLSIQLCEAAAMDSIPPKVLTDGLGNRAAGRVPELMFVAFVVSVEHDALASARSLQAGCVWLNCPVVPLNAVKNMCEAAATGCGMTIEPLTAVIV